MSSWLFGRRREHDGDDDEDDDDDEYSEGDDEYTSSEGGEEEEDAGFNGGVEEQESDPAHVETMPGPSDAAAKLEEEDPPRLTGDVVGGVADIVVSMEEEKVDDFVNQDLKPAETHSKASVKTNGDVDEVSDVVNLPQPSKGPVEKKENDELIVQVESKFTTETSTTIVDEAQHENIGGDNTEKDSASDEPDTNGTSSEALQSLEASKKSSEKIEVPEEELEEVTSTHEKRSLLVLAAEHDRVDILKAILSDDSEDRDALLNSSIPPLHISITYGSTNAVQCLLRMGADPSVRPNVKKIKEQADAGEEAQLVDIPNMGRFDNLSAWELAFGKGNNLDETKNPATSKKGGSWFSSSGDAGKTSSSVDIAPSKLEGIRHAFTAEALRCIGSDEAVRLKQLLDSGMPSTIDIGGKNLYDWCVEMGALQCEELLRPAEADRICNTEADSDQKGASTDKTAVLDRSTPGTESLSQLTNRIDELESLSKALSSCLDNLAEEVSVCHGLLLMGGGATALASHVRSLKALKQSKADELERYQEAWENSEDELAYWARECGEEGKEIAELVSTAIISSAEKVMSSSVEGNTDDEHALMQQLKAQSAALEHKIRKLRASIADLSEESSRALEEVEKRGLSGGIKLVRTLREELREIEFALNETKSAEALCRAKIKVIQSKVSVKKHQSHADSEGEATVVGKEETGNVVDDVVKTSSTNPLTQANDSTRPEPTSKTLNGHSQHHVPLVMETESERRETSAALNSSNAVALQKPSSHGYFTVDLWEILLRIIGLRSSSRSSTGSQNAMSNVMIV